MRRSRGRAPAVLGLLLAACEVPEPAPIDTDTDVEATWQIDRLVLVASFGYAPEADAAVAAATPTEDLPPRAWLVAADPRWAGDLSDPPDACVLAGTLADPTPGSDWPDAPTRFALELDPTSWQASPSCDTHLGAHPEEALAALRAADWGVGVHPTLDPAVAAALASRELDPADYVGAGLRGTVTSGAYAPQAGAAWARAVEEGFEVTNNVLSAARITAGEGLTEGWYTLEVSVSWEDVAATLELTP